MMSELPGGGYYVGEEDQEEAADDDSNQPHDIKPFAIDTATISLRQFFMFLGRTAHISHAEKVGYSLVLAAFAEKSLLPKEDDAKLEWIKVPRASWRLPEGPHQAMKTKRLLDYPVTHLAYSDAEAYCKKMGKRLPTAAEWEYAARGAMAKGTESWMYTWGPLPLRSDRPWSNFWQGDYPMGNTKVDGYVGPSPVISFEPSVVALHNMLGNVWEWTSTVPCGSGKEGEKVCGADEQHMRVIKGGSYRNSVLDDSAGGGPVTVLSAETLHVNTTRDDVGFRCVQYL